MNILILCSHPYSLITFRGKLIETLVYRKNKVFVMAPNINSNIELINKLKKLGVESINYPINNRSLNIFNDLLTILKISYNLIHLNIGLVLPYTIKPIIYSGLSIRFIRLILKKNIQFFPLVTGLGLTFTKTSKKVILINF